MIPKTWLVVLLAGCLLAVSSVGAPTHAAAEISPEQRTKLEAVATKGLESDQNDVRRLAILSIGAMADKKNLKGFKAYLKDADPVVQQAALIALATRGEKDGIKGIEKILQETSPEALPAALESLVRPLSAERQKELLEDLLKKPANEPLRQALAVFAMRAVEAEAVAWIGSVKKLKKSEDKVALLDALSKNPHKASLAIAEEAYGDKDAATRAKAIALAAAIGDQDALKLVARGLADADQGIKDAAEATLKALQHPAIVPLLEQRIKDNPKDFVSIEALIHFQPSNLVEVLEPLVKSEDPKLEQDQYNMVMALIAASKSQQAKDLLRARLAGSFENGRAAATYAIGFTEDRTFTSDLTRLVFDGSTKIRLAAAQSMGRMKDPIAIDAIKKALDKEVDQEVKIALVRALGDIGDKAAAKHLQFLVTSKDNGLRHAALDAFVQLKAIEATTAIEFITQDPDPALRWHAIVTLFLIDPVVYGERLKKAVPDAPEDAFFETLAELSDEMRAKLEEEVLRGTRSSLALKLIAGWAATGRAGLPRLRQAVALSPAAEVKLAALKAMAEFADPQDVDHYKGLLEHTDRMIRVMAMQTLLRYERASVEDVFLAQLDADDPLFQMLGVYGLVK